MSASSDNAQIFKALMPSAPGPVTVSVVVTVTEQNRNPELSAELSVPVITKQLALAIEFFCKTFMEARINLFIRPLWDPLRDLTFQPMTRTQAKQLDEFSRDLTHLTHKLLQVYTGAKTTTRAGQGGLRATRR